MLNSYSTKIYRCPKSGDLEYNLKSFTDSELIALLKSCQSDMQIFTPADPAYRGALQCQQKVIMEQTKRRMAS